MEGKSGEQISINRAKSPVRDLGLMLENVDRVADIGQLDRAVFIKCRPEWFNGRLLTLTHSLLEDILHELFAESSRPPREK